MRRREYAGIPAVTLPHDFSCFYLGAYYVESIRRVTDPQLYVVYKCNCWFYSLNLSVNSLDYKIGVVCGGDYFPIIDLALILKDGVSYPDYSCSLNFYVCS